MINESSIVKDKRGGWCSFEIKGNNVTFQIINLCRISDSAMPRVLKTNAQYDRQQRKVRTAKQCREELLNNIANEIKRKRNRCRECDNYRRF